MTEILQSDINNAARRIADHLLDIADNETDGVELAEWLNVGTDDITDDITEQARIAVYRYLTLKSYHLLGLNDLEKP